MPRMATPRRFRWFSTNLENYSLSPRNLSRMWPAALSDKLGSKS